VRYHRRRGNFTRNGQKTLSRILLFKVRERSQPDLIETTKACAWGGSFWYVSPLSLFHCCSPERATPRERIRFISTRLRRAEAGNGMGEGGGGVVIRRLSPPFHAAFVAARQNFANSKGGGGGGGG